MNAYKLELSPELDAKITVLAVESGQTRADAMRHALALYALVAEKARDGNQLAIVNKDGRVNTIITSSRKWTC
jgi:predicted transcriptional regulator